MTESSEWFTKVAHVGASQAIQSALRLCEHRGNIGCVADATEWFERNMRESGKQSIERALELCQTYFPPSP